MGVIIAIYDKNPAATTLSRQPPQAPKKNIYQLDHLPPPPVKTSAKRGTTPKKLTLEERDPDTYNYWGSGWFDDDEDKIKLNLKYPAKARAKGKRKTREPYRGEKRLGGNSKAPSTQIKKEMLKRGYAEGAPYPTYDQFRSGWFE